jgi:hypothetical protein
LERGAVEVAGVVTKAHCLDGGLFLSTAWKFGAETVAIISFHSNGAKLF